jgi:hypothetical protein
MRSLNTCVPRGAMRSLNTCVPRGAMRSLNTSPSFRVRCAEFAPFLVGGFYQIADSVNPGAAELAR